MTLIWQSWHENFLLKYFFLQQAYLKSNYHDKKKSILTRLTLFEGSPKLFQLYTDEEY
jgi:hypothetical protein